MTLLELAERCEKATGADRELDVGIADAMATHAKWQELFSDVCAPLFTASLDAAMTLVPVGWVFVRLQRERSWRNDPRGDVYLLVAEMMEPRGDGYAKAYALTGPLALCAAALRARASQEEQG